MQHDNTTNPDLTPDIADCWDPMDDFDLDLDLPVVEDDDTYYSHADHTAELAVCRGLASYLNTPAEQAVALGLASHLWAKPSEGEDIPF